MAWFVLIGKKLICWWYRKRGMANVHRWTITGLRSGAAKGVKTINVTEKTGYLVAIKEVTDDDDLMIINKSGITIRMEVSNLRVMGRATQGVKLIRLNENDEISSVEIIEMLEVEEEESDKSENLDSESGKKEN